MKLRMSMFLFCHYKLTRGGAKGMKNIKKMLLGDLYKSEKSGRTSRASTMTTLTTIS